MYELKVITRFAAAHQLRMVDKKCENLHGHNWRIEIRIRGNHLNAAGVLMDFGDLKARIKPIIEKLDHQFLNDVDGFDEKTPPSSENIAKHIAEALQVALPETSLGVHQVTAWESENACASYFPSPQKT